ncbi:MAG: putative toxin-antitoxin system toxin component, PIN family [Deltaproteobacteria bacterium]|nr:putative toxin-antitoxin system toxin component, PIN family [Deltaproteobacteria bacterium]
MKLLLDTNVLIAAVITRGFCAELFEHCVRSHTLITSKFIIKEFHEKMISKFYFSKKEAKEVENLIFSRMEIVKPLPVEPSECPDPNDTEVLGTALEGECQFLITGDKALIKLGHFEGVEILSPSQFWRRESFSQ